MLFIRQKLTIVIDQAYPQGVLKFLDSIDSFSRPCTEQEIAKMLRKKQDDRNFQATARMAKYFNLVEVDSGLYFLSGVGRQLLMLTGSLQKYFACKNIGKLEPFPSLTRELQKRGEMDNQAIGDFLSVTFNRKWKKPKTKLLYGTIYAGWLDFLGIGKRTMTTVTYSLGVVKTAGIPVLDEAGADKTLYDRLMRYLRGIPVRIHKRPQELVAIASNTKLGDKERGKAFEDFVGESFWRFGFEYRTQRTKGTRDYDVSIWTKGSGDVALFYHNPISTNEGIKEGYAIACEAKATAKSIGSRIMSQVETFVKRIRTEFPKYQVHQIIVSRSRGYDQTALPTAFDTVHFSHEILLNLLKLQEILLKSKSKLITPIHFAHLIDALIREHKVNPTKEETIQKVKEMFGLKQETLSST